ncbi:hypothetical protein ACIQU6_41365 [Streptomyces sp. NPDC090442]|uniref:hypothetical protein n=1 Tax=Streptomyces sp. NPDC090442 TaxID=3365962 RepID=UPI00381E85E5
MSKKPTAAELREQRKQRRAGGRGAGEAQDAGAEGAGGGALTAVTPAAEADPVIAQGRAEPMMGFADLPVMVDAPEDLTGPLSAEEQERWETCQRSFRQLRDAWWVAARALEISLRGRLWRADYATAKDFISDVAGMSTSNAYRQIAGAGIAAIIAGQPAIELKSNDQSRMRDSGPPLLGETLVEGAHEPDSTDQSRMRDSNPDPQQKTPEKRLIISQRAAEALSPIREDYNEETAAHMYRAVADETGRKSVSERAIKGIVTQLPRRKEEELDREELIERARQLARASDGKDANPQSSKGQDKADPLETFRKYVAFARDFAHNTTGMATAYAAAEAANAKKARKLALELERHMKRATANFPDA